MGNMEYLLKLIQFIEELGLARCQEHSILLRIGHDYFKEGEIPHEQMEEVYKISDDLFSYICSKQGIPQKYIKYF